MKHKITVKQITFGEGRPKIAVPLVAENEQVLQQQVEALYGLPFDLVEWRADFLHQVEDLSYVLSCSQQLRRLLPDTPILFTFRNVQEGGVHQISSTYYFQLLQAVIQSGNIDIVDIELFAPEKEVKNTIQIAKSHYVFALLCNHDFEKTPPKNEIINRLRRMQEWGADLCKIAVMSQSSADVLVLLDATETMQRCYATQPIITMSMGQYGIISRLAGEVFGSAMTFGAAQKASAPGQIAVKDLAFCLQVLKPPN